MLPDGVLATTRRATESARGSEVVLDNLAASIEQLLAQDPRPAYQGLEKNRPDALREYGMAYDRVNVRFVVGPEGLTVVAVQPVTGLLRDPADESGPEVFPAD